MRRVMKKSKQREDEKYLKLYTRVRQFSVTTNIQLVICDICRETKIKA